MPQTQDQLDPLTLALQTLNAPRVAGARRANTSTPRPDALYKRFLNWVGLCAASTGRVDVELPLTVLAKAWCEKFHAPQAGRNTPHATITAHVGTIANEGRLPEGIRFVKGAERVANGGPKVTALVIEDIDPYSIDTPADADDIATFKRALLNDAIARTRDASVLATLRAALATLG